MAFVFVPSVLWATLPPAAVLVQVLPGLPNARVRHQVAPPAVVIWATANPLEVRTDETACPDFS